MCPLSGYWTRGIASGDVNGDGRDDVAVTMQAQFDLFTQMATGTLAAAGLSLWRPKARIADVTSDGRADVVVIGWDSDAVSVYAQTAAGTLSGPTNYNVPLSGYNDSRSPTSTATATTTSWPCRASCTPPPTSPSSSKGAAVWGPGATSCPAATSTPMG